MGKDRLPAAEIIEYFGMQPHPEGGHFVETFRDEASTAIYFLLQAGERSHWHRVHKSVEIWHHYAGSPLALSMSSDGQSSETYALGSNLSDGEKPQLIVPAGCWQMAESLGAWTLVGCSVAPAFDFENFELALPDWYPHPE